jgi:serine/threonine protein kinase
LKEIDHQAQEFICQLDSFIEDKFDLWLVFELCQGKPISKLLYKQNGLFVDGQRIYSFEQTSTVQALEQNDCQEFKKIVKMLLGALDLLSQIGVVHADLKPENIIV